MPSFMLILAITASLSLTAARTACTAWRGKRARFSRVPPQESVRLLRPGLRKALSR